VQAFADLQHDGLRKVFRPALAHKAGQIAQNPRPKAVVNRLEVEGGCAYTIMVDSKWARTLI
jgi:hypothetical protein